MAKQSTQELTTVKQQQMLFFTCTSSGNLSQTNYKKAHNKTERFTLCWALLGESCFICHGGKEDC